MQVYDVIASLPSSKYSPRIFAQRKPIGKLGLLIASMSQTS